MKGKLQFLLLILCLGIFAMPKQLLSAPESTMECCEKRDSSEQSCHEENNKTSETSKDTGCTGSCCTSCGVCSVTVTPALVDNLLIPGGSKKFNADTGKTPYKTPFSSFQLKEIWQPPKIS